MTQRANIYVDGGKVAISFHLHGELNVLVPATLSLDLPPLHVSSYQGTKYVLFGHSPASTLINSFLLLHLLPHPPLHACNSLI
jgi:hypothetical protein